MTIGFDAYSLVARILPGYITIIPLSFPFLFSSTNLQLSLGAAALILPVLYFIAYQIGRSRGQRKEKELWQKWGGPPTTRFLRHSNGEYDADKRNALHKKLSQLGITVPTKDEESVDPVSADKCYRNCAFEVIRRTRSLETYPLVLRSLVSYGLQRNLLGLKSIGIVITLFSIAMCSIIAVLWQTQFEQFGSTALAIFLNLALLMIWVFGVNESRVKRADEEYAHFLLEAALNLNK